MDFKINIEVDNNTVLNFDFSNSIGNDNREHTLLITKCSSDKAVAQYKKTFSCVYTEALLKEEVNSFMNNFMNNMLYKDINSKLLSKYDVSLTYPQ